MTLQHHITQHIWFRSRCVNGKFANRRSVVGYTVANRSERQKGFIRAIRIGKRKIEIILQLPD